MVSTKRATNPEINVPIPPKGVEPTSSFSKTIIGARQFVKASIQIHSRYVKREKNNWKLPIKGREVHKVLTRKKKTRFEARKQTTTIKEKK